MSHRFGVTLCGNPREVYNRPPRKSDRKKRALHSVPVTFAQLKPNETRSWQGEASAVSSCSFHGTHVVVCKSHRSRSWFIEPSSWHILVKESPCHKENHEQILVQPQCCMAATLPGCLFQHHTTLIRLQVHPFKEPLHLVQTSDICFVMSSAERMPRNTP